MTKQEQIEKLAQMIGRIKDDCENCGCKSCEVNGEDCCCVHYICATFLVDAGYGDVSEYKAEIERLKSNNGFLQCVISHSKDIMDEAVKQAQIDVLNKAKERAVGLPQSLNTNNCSQLPFTIIIFISSRFVTSI